MIDLTPRPMRLLECYDDGEAARHFSFAVEPLADEPVVQPGQFFMLAVPGVGEAAFTYVSPPDAEGRFSALIRQTGTLTAALFELEPGAVLGYRGPFGRGWSLPEPGERLLLVAGGCGLAPLAGLIDAAAGEVQLIYAARNRAYQVLAQERARWRGKLTLVETLDQGDDGRPQGNPLGALEQALTSGAAPSRVFCCGPEPLMLAVARRSIDHGLPASRVWLSLERRMHCGVGLCGHCYIGSSYACIDGPTYRYDEYLHLLAASGQAAATCMPPQPC
ncbi:FAD/NAD(P)-binding protein [Stutzerimonas stutzeri]|uniref:2-polyprenylphenol hydroxylase-like oxidoreductase n=1 Tax=Stutzerimonas stutzeri RCH2 TaxID=644801 RepID=L0GNN9_STUST|nr:FAD/NAD(P)-binding protein [Stutzerimonas stutzeri]AGA88378.1 2-polyprenylphenol hydroxylase-like oxidoreductase [Stutzerimonas stutzeri RCH2]